MKKGKILRLCVVSFLLVAVLLTSITIDTRLEKNINNNNQLAIVDTESSEMQASIDKAYEEKLGANYKEKLEKNSQAVNIAQQFNSKFQKTKSGEINYSSDFGGMYINDNQELVIQVVNNHKTNSKAKTIASNIDDNVKYEYVENSNEELESVNNKIIDYFSNTTSIYEGFRANYIDTPNNIIVVELKNNTKEEQDWFKENVVDSKLIKFVQNNNQFSDTKTYNAGSAYSYIINMHTYSCSVGYRAKRNGVVGFVTAGHCVNKENQVIDNVGTVIKRVYSGSTGVDAAFIQLASGNSITNNIEYPYPYSNSTSISTTTVSAPVFGSFVAKAGYKTGATAGQIDNVNYSYNYGGEYWAKLVHTTVDAVKGDSGGIVYIYPTNPSNISGIVKAVEINKENEEIIPNTMMFSRADYINNVLKTVRY